MRTTDESTGSTPTATDRGRPGRAARLGVPTITLPREPGRTPGVAAVPSQASTGIADLLRGPERPARVLMSVPAAVYLAVPGPQGADVVGVLASDAARLPLGCVLFRPSNGRPLVNAAAGASDSTGAGCSGSGCPSTVGSIQADSLPSL